MQVLDAIIEVWRGKPVEEVLRRFQAVSLPGYSLEYMLYALRWIFEQEDINFKGRSRRKQEEIDEVLDRCGVDKENSPRGSELPMALFCNIALGLHPVEAFIKANLDVVPRGV